MKEHEHKIQIFGGAARGALLLGTSACGTQGTASFASPVELTVWTYYNGDQLDSFNRLVEEFNDTVGRERNIEVIASGQGSVNDLETNVMNAAEGKVGAEAMPNIFSAYADTAYAIDRMGLVGISRPISMRRSAKSISKPIWKRATSTGTAASRSSRPQNAPS